MINNNNIERKKFLTITDKFTYNSYSVITINIDYIERIEKYSFDNDTDIRYYVYMINSKDGIKINEENYKMLMSILNI